MPDVQVSDRRGAHLAFLEPRWGDAAVRRVWNGEAYMSKHDTIGQLDLTSVLEMDFRLECAGCGRPITDSQAFRTVAPSLERYHVECINRQVVGSNARGRVGQ